MYLDILIFAIIAAFLVYRLNATLGARNGEERPRQNPFATPEAAPRPVQAPLSFQPVSTPKQPLQTAVIEHLIDPVANKEGQVKAGLDEIAAADPTFDVSHFVAGAKYAFETIVSAYNRGDRQALKPLLSPKLFSDFAAGIQEREGAGLSSETKIHKISAVRIVEAHLGGTMAYVTIDYDVEQTTVTTDKTGAIVSGNPADVVHVEDIWTFTRDIRSADPNWILIETRATEK